MTDVSNTKVQQSWSGSNLQNSINMWFTCAFGFLAPRRGPFGKLKTGSRPFLRDFEVRSIMLE
jgi:hypothetical protein